MLEHFINDEVKSSVFSVEKSSFTTNFCSRFFFTIGHFRDIVYLGNLLPKLYFLRNIFPHDLNRMPIYLTNV